MGVHLHTGYQKNCHQMADVLHHADWFVKYKGAGLGQMLDLESLDSDWMEDNCSGLVDTDCRLDMEGSNWLYSIVVCELVVVVVVGGGVE